MNDGLFDGFRHNTWSTNQVLGTCRELTGDQLTATVPGVYGNIHEILWHIVSSEAGYCARLTGEAIPWRQESDELPDLGALAAYNDELAVRWERFLEEPFDAERIFVIRWYDGRDRDVPAGVVLAQALHHGTDHRSQICTILTTLDVEPPELGLWDYAEATNRAAPRDA